MRTGRGGALEIETPTDFVEATGELFDRMGQPRIAGRLFGHLLVCEPPEQSQAQLQDATGASAGSVSTMLRLLQGIGLVDRRAEPGGRTLQYRIRSGAFSRMLSRRMRLVDELERVAEAGLDVLGPGCGERGDRLREMRDCYAFFSREFPALVERYRCTREDDV